MDRFCPTIENERMANSNSPLGTLFAVELIPANDADGNKVKPTIHASEVVGYAEDAQLDSSLEYLYNNVIVRQGELAIFHDDSSEDKIANITNGELVITPLDDDSLKYNKQDADLIYGE